jgi:hypothetical protein
LVLATASNSSKFTSSWEDIANLNGAWLFVCVCVWITKKLSKSCTNYIQIIRIQFLPPAPTITNSSFMLARSPSLSLECVLSPFPSLENHVGKPDHRNVLSSHSFHPNIWTDFLQESFATICPFSCERFLGKICSSNIPTLSVEQCRSQVPKCWMKKKFNRS